MGCWASEAAQWVKVFTAKPGDCNLIDPWDHMIEMNFHMYYMVHACPCMHTHKHILSLIYKQN